MNTVQHKLLIISGPTAVGKTSLGITLAQKFGGEILSADSRQVYRGMDIVTGKDTGQAKFEIRYPSINSGQVLKYEKVKPYFTVGYYKVEGIRIWGLDIVEPEYLFNVADFLDYAAVILPLIWEKGRLPIVVGGTGLYLQALGHPPATVGIKPDWQLRGQLSGLSVPELQAVLKKKDSQRFKRMNDSDKINKRRLIRAIEILRDRGTPSDLSRSARKNLPPMNTLSFALTAPRAELYRRIDERVETMVAQGAEQEVREMLKRGIPLTSPSMTGTGYAAYLTILKNAGQLLSPGEEQRISQLWKYADHAFARRQLTWLGKQPGLEWYDVTDPEYPIVLEKRVRAWYT
jgi:tRNA dimethylallyltransferase